MDAGSTTTPQPITQRQPGRRMPDGSDWNTKRSLPTMTVWPALLPPWYRTTTSTCEASTSTSLPLASSPHCAPTTTMLGMTTLLEPGEVPGGIGEQLTRAQHALRPALSFRTKSEYGNGVGAASRFAEHEHPARALLPRVGERVGQSPADDTPGQPPAGVAIAPGEGEGLG